MIDLSHPSLVKEVISRPPLAMVDISNPYLDRWLYHFPFPGNVRFIQSIPDYGGSIPNVHPSPEGIYFVPICLICLSCVSLVVVDLSHLSRHWSINRLPPWLCLIYSYSLALLEQYHVSPAMVILASPFLAMVDLSHLVVLSCLSFSSSNSYS